MFENHNKSGRSVVPASITDLSKLPFVGLKEYIGKEIIVEGYFFTEGKFGTQVSVIANGQCINMPKRCVEEFLSFTEEEKRAVLDKKLKLTDIKSAETKNGTTTVFTYAEVE